MPWPPLFQKGHVYGARSLWIPGWPSIHNSRMVDPDKVTHGNLKCHLRAAVFILLRLTPVYTLKIRYVQYILYDYACIYNLFWFSQQSCWFSEISNNPLRFYATYLLSEVLSPEQVSWQKYHQVLFVEGRRVGGGEGSSRHVGTSRGWKPS